MLDGAGEPVPDGLVEIWQAGADGRYEEGHLGWGRCQTDAGGGYAFTTVKPGAVSEADGTTLAPHLTVLCFARGLLKPVLTRLYFSDEQAANAADPVLQAIARRRRARHAGRDGRSAPRPTASTSGCRATSRRSSSRRRPSGL